jgi:hypothetical protein
MLLRSGVRYDDALHGASAPRPQVGSNHLF